MVCRRVFLYERRLGRARHAVAPQSRSLALAVGSSYQVTNTVTIPANAPPSYYLIFKTDDQNTIFEASETNNWRAFGVGQYREADGDGIPDLWEEGMVEG